VKLLGGPWELTVSPQRGGRITSLHLDGHELLDQGIGVDDPSREGFVEAGAFGWDEMVATVNKAYRRLSPEERPGCGILAQNYGQAGAIDFLGRPYGLPPALSGHQTYFLWGPRGYSGNCLIVLDDSRETLEGYFEHVEYVGKSTDNPYAMEREIPVFICRGARFGTLADIWPRLKKWR